MTVEAASGWARTRSEWAAAAPAAVRHQVRTDRRLHTEQWAKCAIAMALCAWAASFVTGFASALTALNVAAFGAAVLGWSRPGLGLLGVGMLCVLEPITGPILASGGLW